MSIQVNNLSFSYGQKNVLHDICFSAEKGEFLSILGPNGAGKSTTMNILTGYLSSTSGTAKIDGFDILDDPTEAKKHIGYLPEILPGIYIGNMYLNSWNGNRF